jgi:histidinol dehydrogenase
MAFGTKTIPAVDLIAGPGNAYVTEAKRRLFGRVGVDLLPGPSEVMVIADGGADPARVAGDLLAQAEHGTGKEKLYLTVPDQTFWKAVRRELEAGTEGLANGKTVAGILADRLFAAVCEDEEAVVALANEIAPEHLELQVAPPAVRALTKRITTAGAILQGYETATALGDFVAGPSHTLPTDGTGRFSGGLQVGHFLRRSSLVRSTPAANRRALPAVEAFARMESLPAHADSLRRRVR